MKWLSVRYFFSPASIKFERVTCGIEPLHAMFPIDIVDQRQGQRSPDNERETCCWRMKKSPYFVSRSPESKKDV